MAGRFLIYALQDPCTWELRYVGRSSDGLRRPAARHAAYCENWRRQLKRAGYKPRILVVQEFVDTTPKIDEVLDAAEIYWIAEFRRRGCPLTNLAGGGGGTCGYRHTDEAKKRIGAACSGPRNWGFGKKGPLSPAFGKRHTPEAVARIRAGNVGRVVSDETRARLSAALKGRVSPRKGKTLTAEQRARLSEAHKGLPCRRGFHLSDETRRKLSTAMTGERNPNFGRPVSPETRAKISLAHQRRWEAKKEGGAS